MSFTRKPDAGEGAEGYLHVLETLQLLLLQQLVLVAGWAFEDVLLLQLLAIALHYLGVSQYSGFLPFQWSFFYAGEPSAHMPRPRSQCGYFSWHSKLTID